MRIYVGNLSYDAGEEHVREVFEAHGEVSEINLIYDRETGRPRGFGFVEMPDNSQGQAAIAALNKTDMMGRAIIVNEAYERSNKPRGGGGGRGGGGRGGSRWD